MILPWFDPGVEMIAEAVTMVMILTTDAGLETKSVQYLIIYVSSFLCVQKLLFLWFFVLI